ncbi:hypothetical protein E1193_13570 [Micromonospora sp. KC606]|uniref:SAP domain-containing protein n=1 Tax=Micromonospora sp. KC606 TaxID=2530379 RepID=UPI001048AAE7|nr:SAP domain-containing protein [Micromonospora sp. KC606]TDC81816.1 hypothetical protein E1193_13570 [Micromonospora sp. KC606]
MTDPTRTAALLVRLADLLRDLPAAEVAALAEGRARLAVVPTDAVAPTSGAHARSSAAGDRASVPRRAGPPATDPDRAVAALAAMTTRGDGTAYLSTWSVRELRALATRLGLRGTASGRKAELVERIVDRTVGFRLDSAAIRQL